MPRMTAKAQMDRLRSKLLDETDPASQRLAKRIDRCGVDWKDGRYRCRLPACVRCKWTNIRKQQRTAQQIFGEYAQEDLAFVSVVLDATKDVYRLHDIIAQSKEHTRNRFKASRMKSARWNGVYLTAWHEIDAVAADQIPLLPPRRRPLIENIAPWSLAEGGPAWIGTYHGIVHLNGLDPHEVAVEFRRQWPLNGQVDVRPFCASQTVAESIDRTVSYVNKFDRTVHLSENQIIPWPVTWEASLFKWLGSYPNAFQSLRFNVGPKGQSPFYSRTSTHNEEDCPEMGDDEDDAMPWLITTNPMSINTGGWW